MKLFVLLSRIPWPLEKGDKLRAYYHIRVLSKRHKIILVCLTDTTPDKHAYENLKPFCEEIHFIRLSKLRIAWNLFKTFFNDKPFQVNYFHQQQAQKQIDSLMAKHMPKHLFVQLIRTAEYVKKYHFIPSTFDYMDAFSVGAKRRKDKSFPIIRSIIGMEARRLKRYEKLVFNKFTYKTIISKTDRDLIEHPENNLIHILPNGVDFSHFTKDPSKTKEYELVFTGNMSYAPNVKAAHYLAEQIMPLLRQHLPKAKLLIAGATPHPSVKRLASKNLHVSGWMNNITDAYNSARIFIAPMEIGTGMQNKILEAMAMEIPCITSPLAGNAIGGINGKNLLLANSPIEYVAHILALLNQPEIYHTLSKNAYEFVHQHFNWENNSQVLIDLVND